ncbi:SusC/RagA family TonB-linked outer membrane protein [Chitinophaga niastensis]|nr:SusC/RagA family TonB-linked outer membrane protein [Chitinophaga niastensis]
MRLTPILILIASLHVSAKSYSQEITISSKNITLEKVFKLIEEQTGFSILWNEKLLDKSHTVSINVKGASLTRVLDICFQGLPLSYRIKDKVVLIGLAPVLQSGDTSHPSHPPIDIHGQVMNDNGEPLPGATVTVKGTGKGTITNAKGEFELKKVEGNAVLVITSVNMETVEMKVEGKTYLIVSAKQRINGLDETVVKGYYNTTKRLNTGTVAKIKGEDIRKQPVDNPILALGGRMPGVQITQVSGIPGAPMSVVIRGKSSLGAGSEPLYVIDGVPFAHSLTSLTFSSGVSAQSLDGLSGASNGTNPFVSINPSDIESIEVLKDADATAIYGSRGANGVVLITTRKAKAGKTTVDVNFYSGWGRPVRLATMMDTKQYVTMRKEAFKNDGIIPTASNATDLMVWDTTRYTDWGKLLIGKQARSNDAQVRLSGGNQQTQFSIATGYHRETPVYYGNMSDTRSSIHSNIIHHSTDDRFSVALSASYSMDNNHINTTDLTQLINTVPNAPYPLDSSGNLVWRDHGINFRNPLAYIFRIYTGKTENLLSSMNMRYRIAKGFSVKVDAGYNSVRLDQVTTNPIKSQSPYSPSLISSAEFYNGLSRNWIIEPQAEYSNQWGKVKLQVLVGGSLQDQTNSGNKISGSDYANDDLLLTPGSAAVTSVNSNYSKYNYGAIFGRVNYNWDGKYLLNASARRDGSSRFGPGKQFGNFGAVGAAWIFSQENFMKNISFLSFGKLRASMGVTGNDRIGDYGFIAIWAPTTSAVAYQGSNGLYPQNLLNPDFAWERNRKWEGAIELSFLKDRIYVSADYYLNKTDNQLTDLILPSQTGFTSITANRDAILQNSGWELMLNTTNVQGKKFTWRSSFNITIPRNKLLRYPDLENSPYASTWSIGMPVTINKSVPYLGVDPKTGIHQLAGISIPNDLTAINDLAQRSYGGLQNTFEYKGWSLDFFFHFVKQKGKTSIQFQTPGTRTNQPIELLDRWQKPGDITDVQRFTTAGAAATQYSYYANYSSARITDASFIRLRNVSLSYRFNQSIAKKINAETIRLYFQAQNLFTFTSYKTGDPETMSFTSMPPLRMLTAGIQVVF